MTIRSDVPRNAIVPSWTLSAILAGLMLVQSFFGIVVPHLYRDNAWVASTWQGNDWVTLVVAVPTLIATVVLSRRNSIRAQLVWLGMMYYALYNNMYYLFGAAFNPMFLVYVAIFVASVSGLILSGFRLDIGEINRRADYRSVKRLVPSFMLLLAAILSVMWIGQYVQFIINGKVPQIMVDAGGVTHLVAALDLSLIVPPLSLGAIWLWQCRPMGYALAVAVLTQCSLTSAVLVVTGPFQAAAGIPGAWDMEPLWLGIFLGCIVCTGVLLKHLSSKS